MKKINKNKNSIDQSKNKSLKQRHVFTKTLWQCFLVFAEIFLAVWFMVWLSDKYWPINESFGYIERGLMFYAVYQIAVFVILNTLNDIKSDSYLALTTNYKRLDLYYKSNDPRIKESIEKNIEYQLDTGTINNIKIRAEYTRMKELIKNKDQILVEYIIICFEHEKEASTLQWRCSFILRLLK